MENYYLYLGNVWSIEKLANVDKKIKFDKINFEHDFGQIEIVNGKIN